MRSITIHGLATLALAGAAMAGSLVAPAAMAQQVDNTQGYTMGTCRPSTARQTYPGPYLVFFDLGKSAIKQSEQATLNQAVQSAKDKQVTEICVIGYADKIGDPAFNKKLSRDRAMAVAAALRAKGIAAKAINVDPEGEVYQGLSFGGVDSQEKDRKVVIVLNR